MKIKTRIALVLPVIATGLLLGGIAQAGGTVAPASASQNVTAQIEQIKQKIADLTAQIQNRQIQTPVSKIVFRNLTQAELDRIESEITRITQRTARIKLEVEVFVVLREIEAKTAALAAQVASPYAGTAGQVSVPVQSPTTNQVTSGDTREIEEKIAKIKQQIAELTQELQIQQSVEQAAQIAGEETEKLSEEPAEEEQESQMPIVIESAPAASAQSEKTGFWQSVGDFLKKLFAF